MFRDAQEVAVLGAGLMGTCIAGKETSQNYPSLVSQGRHTYKALS